MDLQATAAIYVYIYITVVWAHNLYTVFSCCPLTKLATRLLAHLGELQCPSCFNGDCAHVELRPSRVYTQVDPLTNTIGYSWNKFLTAAGRTVNKTTSCQHLPRGSVWIQGMVYGHPLSSIQHPSEDPGGLGKS